jgi:hypothetical protein
MLEALKRNKKAGAAVVLLVVLSVLAFTGVIPGAGLLASLRSYLAGTSAAVEPPPQHYSTVKPEDIDDEPIPSFAPHSTAEPAAAFDDDYAGSLDGLESPQKASYSVVDTTDAYPINDRIESIITSRNGGMLPTLDVRGDYETQPFADNLCLWNQSSAQKGIQLGYVKDTEVRRKVALT